MPVAIAPQLEEIVEARSLFATAERPITFDEFLTLFGPEDDVELIDGVAQKRVAAQLDHERLYAFLFHLLDLHAQDWNLGQVFGSRTAVRISQFRGRLPDLLFVRQANLGRMEPSGIRFAPDLVIEIVSPGDRLSDIVALETDYRNIRVPEILFIDQRQKTVRVRRLRPGAATDAEYDEFTFGPGDSILLESLNDVVLPVDWLSTEPRPTVRVALAEWSPAT
jgi:Uma2 family endonuclease